MELAPVLIPTLNRFEHLRRCLESLANCLHSEKTEVIIALDYPLKEEHNEGYIKILDYLESVDCFKNLRVIKRQENYGPYRNIFTSIDEVFVDFEKVIVSEDDNVFSFDFLNFVNKGLSLYESREDIFGVTGYCYPVDVADAQGGQAFLWQGLSAWGVGFWRSKYFTVDWKREVALGKIRKFIFSPNKVYKHFKRANHLIENKLEMLKRREIYGDSYLSWYLIENNKFVVFPIVTRVRNTGHDGSGVHCGSDDCNVYGSQELYSQGTIYVLDFHLQESELVNEVLYNHFELSFRGKLSLLKRLFKFYVNNFWRFTRDL